MVNNRKSKSRDEDDCTIIQNESLSGQCGTWGQSGERELSDEASEEMEQANNLTPLISKEIHNTYRL